MRPAAPPPPPGTAVGTAVGTKTGSKPATNDDVTLFDWLYAGPMACQILLLGPPPPSPLTAAVDAPDLRLPGAGAALLPVGG